MWYKKHWSDIKNNCFSSHLMPLKFLFFVIYAGNATLIPYLAVHLQSLGFGANKAAVIFAIIPILSATGPTIVGAIADKMGNFKALFSGVVALSGALSLLLLCVPRVPDPPGLNLMLVTDNLPPQDREGVDKYAQELTQQETGKIVDAEYIQWIVLTKTSGCEIDPNYMTNMDNLLKVDIAQAEPKSTVNVTGTETSSNYALLTITTHHPVSCPNNASKTLIVKEGIDMMINMLGHHTEKLRNVSSYFFDDVEISNFTNLEEFEKVYRGDEKKLWFKRGCEIKIPGLCGTATIEGESISFWSYLGARGILNGFVNSAITLFEGATLTLIKEHDGDYGLQRMWGYLGSMVLTPVSGFLIDLTSSSLTAIDYRPAFYLFVGFQVTAGILALTVNLKFKPPNKEIIKNIIRFLKNPQIIMLFVAMFLSGSYFGFLEAFLFWFLGDLGASRYLMGLTVTVGSAAALPFLVVATPIVNYFGHCSVISFAFLMYAIRFAGYASIYNPYHALWFEVMEGITIGLMLTASFMYAGQLSTNKNVVTLQAIASTLHYEIGKGAGSLVGGQMYHHFGARKTFRLFSVANMFSAIAFFIFHLIYIRRRQRRISMALAAMAEKDALLQETELQKLREAVALVESRAATPLVIGNVVCGNCSKECTEAVLKVEKAMQTEPWSPPPGHRKDN